MNTELAVPETKEILTPETEQKIITISDRAALVKVIDDASLIVADEVETDIKALIKVINDDYEDPIKDAHALHKKLLKRRDDKTGPLEKLLEPIKIQRLDYQAEQKKKREAEEARLLKEAQEREEAERVAAAAEQEKEAARLKAEADEEASRAEALASEGKVEEAVALLDQSASKANEAISVQQEAEKTVATPSYVPPPRMTPAPKTKNALKMIVDRGRLQTIADMLTKGTTKTPPSIPGVRFFQTWSFEVYNSKTVPETYRKPS